MDVKERKFGSILITPKCSNNCIFCKDHSLNNSEDLTQEDEKKLLRDTLYFVKNRFENADISGSEPLKYSKIISYLKWIRPKFKEIILLDPGNMLADKEFAKDFAKIKIDQIIIPMYGSNEAYHDSVVDNKGAFEKVTKGIKNLLELNDGSLKIELSTMILKQNIDNITDLMNFCLENFRIYPTKIALPHLHKDNKAIKFDEFKISFQEVKQIILELNSMKKFSFCLHYAPPCIFKEEELLSLANISFFNIFYLYNLSNDQATQEIKKTVNDYRKQVYSEFCGKCYLAKEKICGGILTAHYNNNKNFEYYPLSEWLYKKIKHMIDFQKLNQ